MSSQKTKTVITKKRSYNNLDNAATKRQRKDLIGHRVKQPPYMSAIRRDLLNIR